MKKNTGLKNERITRFIRCLPVCASVFIFSCESVPPTETVLESVPTASITPIPNARLDRLKSLLQQRQIETVGLEYESDASLDRLEQLMSDKQTMGRRIKQLYTGAAMAYDSKLESLTVGGHDPLAKMLQFISKIPLR